MNVLLVEDDMDYAPVAQSYLRRIAPKATCRHAASLAEALSMVAAEKFDVCLLDLNLPDSQGVATVTTMSAAAPTLPLVVLTAEVIGDTDLDALQAGAEDYLAKSELSVATLRRAIRYARERHRLAQSLARASQLNRLILEHVPDSIELLDGEWRLAFINPAGLAALRAADDRREALGQDWLSLWDAPSREALRPLLERARVGEVAMAQARLTRCGGAPRWLDIKIAPLPDDGGQPARYLAVIHDFTELRRHEERLRRAQQSELLSHIAGGIAHNFNNLLTVVQGCSEMMLRALPETDSRQRRRASDIRQAAARGHSLVERLLRYAHPGEPTLKVMGLNDFLDQERSVFEKLLGPMTSLRLALAAPEPKVYADALLLLRVLVKLVANANDAMPDGGRLTLSTKAIYPDTAAMQKLAAPTYRTAGGELTPSLPARLGVVSVGDTGHGMSAETLAMIFTPFFTTKPVDKGAGLSLSIAASLVTQMGGFIGVESAPGAGARFDVYLPAAADADAEGQSSDCPPAH